MGTSDGGRKMQNGVAGSYPGGYYGAIPPGYMLPPEYHGGNIPNQSRGFNHNMQGYPGGVPGHPDMTASHRYPPDARLQQDNRFLDPRLMNPRMGSVIPGRGVPSPMGGPNPAGPRLNHRSPSQEEDSEDDEERIEGFSNAKTILVIAIVVGCFAVLWPKIFYPMLFGNNDTSSLKDGPTKAPPPPPIRTVEKEWAGRGGPMPGMRPTLGAAHGMHPTQPKSAGTMGIIMPIYTVGIIIFFVYTTMKIMFKNKNEEEEELNGKPKPKTPADDSNSITEEFKLPEGETAGLLPPYPSPPSPTLQPTPPPYSQNDDVRGVEEIPIIPADISEPATADIDNGNAVEKKGDSDKQIDQPKENPKRKSKKKKKEVHKRAITAAVDKTTSSDISEDEQDKIVDRKTTSDSTYYRDKEILLLKQRLDQTERTMERIVEQIGAVTSKLQPLILAQAILAQQKGIESEDIISLKALVKDNSENSTQSAKENKQNCDNNEEKSANENNEKSANDIDDAKTRDDNLEEQNDDISESENESDNLESENSADEISTEDSSGEGKKDK